MSSENIQQYLEKTKTAPHWNRVGIRHHHGIYLPLFALHTKKSCGIGDFGDLFPLIDWCKYIGFDCIQLLPINDTAEDPSPYNALSSCAIDPIYLNLRELPDSGHLAADLEKFAPFNDLARLPHAEVRYQKLQWLDHYFERTFPDVKNSSEYQAFLAQNPWLRIYSLFKACKDEYGGKYWQEWPLDKQSPEHCTANPRSIDLHCFLQFHAYRQMEAVKHYAEANRILLKGDIPILLSPDSTDVWAHRSLFNMHYVAGAPPDYYNRHGQKWGFPLFNWEEMQRTQFNWWKQRLQAASRLFHIYRIDHVVGFFRIWAIRKEDIPEQGQYIPADPHQWGRQGREILEMMIRSSPLLPMAEDLGNIPDVVFETLHHLGICSTKVIRWCRHWESDGRFIPLSEYDPISLTTVSTHDSEPLQLWWKTQHAEALKYAEFKHWNYEPVLAEWQQREILYDAHHSPSLFHINLLQEYLALFPELVSSNPEDERINVPGTLLPTNWTYRFKPSVEEIASHRELEKEIRNIIT